MKASSLKDIVAQVKHAYSLADYVAGSGIRLTTAGVNKHKGLCPFHSEKTPSFIVDDRFENYICFGCGAKGDIISFVQQLQGLDFLDALSSLAQDKGISVDFDDDSQRVDYVSLKKCTLAAAKFFAAELAQKHKLGLPHPALAEIESRGLTVREGGKYGAYGFSPNSKSALFDHLKSLGFSDSIIEQAGLVRRLHGGDYADFFKGRLVFTITDAQGRPVGFSARRLYDDDPLKGKYVNTPATPIFDKKSLLYNFTTALKVARNAGRIFVVEGQFDVRACVSAGVENVVASCGTAFTQTHADLCRRAVGDKGRVVFVFDGDKAGIGAMSKVFSEIPSLHTQAFAVALPAGDPCDYRQQHGDKALRELLEQNQVPLAEFVFDTIRREANLSVGSGRARFVEQVAGVLSSISSRPLLDSLCRQAALYAQTELENVVKAVQDAKRGKRPSQIASKSGDEQTPASSERVYDESVSEQAIVDKIKDTLPLQATARAIKIAIANPTLIPLLEPLRQNQDCLLIPFIRELFDKYNASQERKSMRLVAEDFSQPLLAQKIISLPDFSLVDSASTKLQQEQLEYLVDYVAKKREEFVKSKRVFKQMPILAAKECSEDVGLLRQAIASFNSAGFSPTGGFPNRS